MLAHAHVRCTILALLALTLLPAPVLAKRAPLKPDAKAPASAEKTAPAPPPSPTPSPTPAPSPAEAKGTTTPYVFFVDDKTVIQSAPAEDVEHARKAREEGDPKLLWFRKEGKEYVLRDPKLLQSVLDLDQAAKKPHEQARTLTKKDTELSGRMETLVQEEEDLNTRLDALYEERQKLETQAGQSEEQKAKVAPDLERLALEEENLNKEIEKRDEEMDRLADSMDTLSTDQAKAREDGEHAASRSEGQIQAILDESVRSGAAKRYRPKT